jgi:predicted GNAT family acetyltransferase
MHPLSADVRQDADGDRFVLETRAGLAVADYRLSDGIMTIYHTEVPISLRGNGIGQQLVLGALSLARRLNVKIVPRCWFVRDVMDRHPEFQDLRC